MLMGISPQRLPTVNIAGLISFKNVHKVKLIRKYVDTRHETGYRKYSIADRL